MSDLTLVQGDTAPDLVAVIHEEDDAETPIDLTGASVAFQMRKADDRRYTVNATMVADDPVNGQFHYEWGTNDLAVPGTYQGQFEITYQDGKIQTTRVPFSIEVRRQ